MTSRTVKKPSDVIKTKQEYLNNLDLQVQLNKVNEEAIRIYKLTGQLPPSTEMKDTRSVSEILLDTEKLKINLIKDLQAVANPQFALEIVNRLIQSPLNIDGSLLIFTAQRIPDLVEQLKKLYKYGIKGDANDAETFVQYIHKYYTDRNAQVTNAKQFMTRMGSNKPMGLTNKLQDQHKQITRIMSNVLHLRQRFVLTANLAVGGILSSLKRYIKSIDDIVSSLDILRRILPQSAEEIELYENFIIGIEGHLEYDSLSEHFKSYMLYINTNVPNFDYVEPLLTQLYDGLNIFSKISTKDNDATITQIKKLGNIIEGIEGQLNINKHELIDARDDFIFFTKKINTERYSETRRKQPQYNPGEPNFSQTTWTSNPEMSAQVLNIGIVEPIDQEHEDAMESLEQRLNALSTSAYGNEPRQAIVPYNMGGLQFSNPSLNPAFVPGGIRGTPPSFQGMVNPQSMSKAEKLEYIRTHPKDVLSEYSEAEYPVSKSEGRIRPGSAVPQQYTGAIERRELFDEAQRLRDEKKALKQTKKQKEIDEDNARKTRTAEKYRSAKGEIEAENKAFRESKLPKYKEYPQEEETGHELGYGYTSKKRNEETKKREKEATEINWKKGRKVDEAKEIMERKESKQKIESLGKSPNVDKRDLNTRKILKQKIELILNKMNSEHMTDAMPERTLLAKNKVEEQYFLNKDNIEIWGIEKLRRFYLQLREHLSQYISKADMRGYGLKDTFHKFIKKHFSEPIYNAGANWVKQAWENTKPKPRTLRGSGLGGVVDTSQGIQPSPSYIRFGKYLINTKKLNNNIISLRRDKGSSIKTIPARMISPHLGSIMKKIIGGGMPSYDDLNKLTDDEKQYLHKVTQESDIFDKLAIPTPSKDKEEQDAHQFNVLKGEIMAGNNSKEVISKFKLLVLKLSKQGILPKNQVQEILEELLELGL